jgi:drug/metabolite transporter (DMT)-like permease
LENNNLKALSLTLSHALLFSLTGVFINLTSSEIGIFEQILYRAVFALAFIFLVFKPKIKDCFKKNAILILSSRGIFGFLGMGSMFYAILNLQLSIAMVLTFTTPIFVMIFGKYFLKEEIKGNQIIPILTVFIGLLFVANITFSDKITFGIELFPFSIGLIGSILTAIAFLSMRSALKIVSTQVVIIWFSLFNIIGSIIISYETLSIPRGNDLYYIIAIAVFGFLSDVTKTEAYKYSVAWFISLVSLSSIVFAVFLGWLILDEYIEVNQIFGIILIVIGITLLILKSRKKAN